MKLKLLSHGPLVRSLMLPRRAGEGDGRNSGDHLGCVTNLIAFLSTQYIYIHMSIYMFVQIKFPTKQLKVFVRWLLQQM